MMRIKYLASGLLLATGLFFIYLSSLTALWQQGQAGDWSELFNDSYFWHILRFSFYQATLSALLSVGLAIFVAHALYYQQNRFSQILQKLFSLTFVLPSLLAVFGIIGVYGAVGWIEQLSSFFGIAWQPNIYGLSGILLAHIFFNLPLATKVILQSLQGIPTPQRKLAYQLNLRHTNFFKLVELPYIKSQLLPLFMLIFMLCFSSFAIVLTLGGGPKFTTLEVAIYQAVTFDFDLNQAAMLALIQFLLCFFLFQGTSLFAPLHTSSAHNHEIWLTPIKRNWQLIHKTILVITALFITLPLLNIVISGLLAIWQGTSIWYESIFWRALGFSITIAPSAGILSILLACSLLLTTRQLNWYKHHFLANLLLNSGMMILAVPTFVLAVGSYLLLRQYELNTTALFVLVVFFNALIALPFVIRILNEPFNHNMQNYHLLCQSLGIRGLNRFKVIEWRTLRRPLRSAMALASALSLGDFTVIALFGNDSFTSLPRLLYQQLGHYRSDQASVTALVLLLCVAMIFLLVEENYAQREQIDL